MLAPAELFQPGGEHVLDLPQARLVGGLGAQPQHAGVGLHGPPTPVQPDDPAGGRPFGVLHLWGRLAGAVGARPVAVTGAAELGGVLAEPGEVLFGILGADDLLTELLDVAAAQAV